jgi:hypothetical protein
MHNITDNVFEGHPDFCPMFSISARSGQKDLKSAVEVVLYCNSHPVRLLLLLSLSLSLWKISPKFILS